MHIKIIAIAKTKEKFYEAAEAEYLKRLGSFTKAEFEILPASRADFDAKVIFEEAEKILDKIKPTDFVVALDKEGSQMSSLDLAKKLDKWLSSSKNLVFVIGGTYGLSQQVLDRADFVWSFSQLTFTHEMVRTILLEQIYRAFTILNNKPYHY